MGIIRRLAILSICLAFTSAAYTCAVWAQDFKVTLLGTGVPFPATDRFGAATLVEAGKERRLFHVGRGAPPPLNQIAGAPPPPNPPLPPHSPPPPTSPPPPPPS